MKEDREDSEGDEGKEPGVEPVEEPEIEAVEEPRLGAGPEAEEQGDEEAGAAGVDETEPEGAGKSEAELYSESVPGRGDKGVVEEIDPSQFEGEPPPERRKGFLEDVEDSLELDRMEVRPTVGIPEEEVRPDARTAESALREEAPPAPSPFLAVLGRYWIWILGFLVLITASSMVLWMVSTPRIATVAPKAGMGVNVFSASLGGEHYVRFNLYGPFSSPEGKEVLARALPKIRHDLILSGGQPDVARSIQENDLTFLEKHILAIVSRATDIPVGRLDLKGLSVVRYSDEEEVGGEMPGANP